MKKHLRTLLSGAWAILALGYLFGISFETLQAEQPFVLNIIIAGFFGAVWMALVLPSKHPWSTWFISVTTVVMTLMVPFVGHLHFELAIFQLLLCLVTLGFAWLKSTRNELRPRVSFRSDALHFIIIFMLASFGVASVAFVVLEGENITTAIQKIKLDHQCQDPKVDVEACGRLGIAQLNSPENDQEMIAGRDLLDGMCQNGHAVACRRLVLARSTIQIDSMKYRNLHDELWARCQQDGGTACLGQMLVSFKRPEGFTSVTKAKCLAGDLDACVAWATVSKEDDEISRAKSCEVGIDGSCSFSGVPAEIRKGACERSKNPWTCFAANGGAEYCDKGVWPACDPVEWPQNQWHRINWSRRLLIAPTPITLAWENLESGRAQIQKSHKDWQPTPMPLAQIETTFGAACDAGIAYGCTEGANAAVNVQLEFRTPERIEHAQKSLNKGCEIGDFLACWFLLSVTKIPAAETMKYARKACYSAPRGVESYPGICKTYVHLWMAEVGLTPWVMDSTLANPETVEKCAQQKEPLLCMMVAESNGDIMRESQPVIMPQHVVARNAAAISCATKQAFGCELLMNISTAWPVEPNQSIQELAKDICAKLPQMCEAVGQ